MKTDSDIESLLGSDPRPADAEASADAVSNDELADFLGVHPRHVGVLVREGTIERVGRGRFSLRASVRAYCEKLRRDQVGRPSSNKDLNAEKLRLARANADKVELANARLRGELAEIREVEAEWSSLLRDVRAGLLAVPSRVQQRLGHLTAHDVQEIDREIRATLEEISNGA